MADETAVSDLGSPGPTETDLGPPGPTEILPFRLIDWGEGSVTIEIPVGHLPRKTRAALLVALNAFVEEANAFEGKKGA